MIPDTNVVDITTPLDSSGTNQRLGLSTQLAYSQERTRAKIAWTFTLVFLLLIIATLLWPTLANLTTPGTYADPLEASKVLTTTMASVLAGPFGFIVGFYFKQGKED